VVELKLPDSAIEEVSGVELPVPDQKREVGTLIQNTPDELAADGELSSVTVIVLEAVTVTVSVEAMLSLSLEDIVPKGEPASVV
jgi:hypothetical protein